MTGRGMGVAPVARELVARYLNSEKTVEHHLAHIYGKLRVAGRAAAVSYALRQGNLLK